MKAFTLIFCAVLSLGFGIVLVDMLSFATNHPLIHLPFAIGTILGGFLFLNYFKTLFVWLHEHSHTILSYIMFSGVHEIYISRHNGGYVRTDAASSYIVSLAPYAIPLFSIIALMLKYVTIPEFHPNVDAGAGFLYGQHLVSVFRDTRITQPDIRQHGMFISFAIIVCLNIICLCTMLLLLYSAGFGAFIELIAVGFQNIFGCFNQLVNFLQDLIVNFSM